MGVDFVLAASEPEETMTGMPSLKMTGMPSLKGGASPKASHVVSFEEADLPEMTMTAMPSLTTSMAPGDYQRARKHSRVVAELFDTEDELVSSLQEAVYTCEARLAKMQLLAEQAAAADDLSDMCWSIVDAMAEQSSQAAALQGKALSLLRTLQREEGERPRGQASFDEGGPTQAPNGEAPAPMVADAVANSQPLSVRTESPRGSLLAPSRAVPGQLSPGTKVYTVQQQRPSLASTAQTVVHSTSKRVQSPHGVRTTTTTTGLVRGRGSGSGTVPQLGPPRQSLTATQQRRYTRY